MPNDAWLLDRGAMQPDLVPPRTAARYALSSGKLALNLRKARASMNRMECAANVYAPGPEAPASIGPR